VREHDVAQGSCLARLRHEKEGTLCLDPGSTEGEREDENQRAGDPAHGDS
jgi:hypothetical protein